MHVMQSDYFSFKFIRLSSRESVALPLINGAQATNRAKSMRALYQIT
jgi:hypothetical protein